VNPHTRQKITPSALQKIENETEHGNRGRRTKTKTTELRKEEEKRKTMNRKTHNKNNKKQMNLMCTQKRKWWKNKSSKTKTQGVDQIYRGRT
jgi:hypothetical protein